MDAAGFGDPASHDALGHDRARLLDGNGVVCSRQPPPGPLPAATGGDPGVVRPGGPCSGEDRSDAPPDAGATAPDLVGESVNVAAPRSARRWT